MSNVRAGSWRCQSRSEGERSTARARRGGCHRRRPYERPREYARLLHFDSLTHSPANLRFLVTEFGAERVAMGSDYPFDMGSPDPVAAVGEAGLDPSARALVEGGTAARFLGL